MVLVNFETASSHYSSFELSFNGPALAANYGYNGLGDRLRQTVNGVTTEYTLDLAAGLT